MFKFITIAEMQKLIGQISSNINEHGFIVTKHGKPSFVILPYYEKGIPAEDYLEDYEMWLNRDKLNKEIEESIASGDSDYII